MTGRLERLALLLTLAAGCADEDDRDRAEGEAAEEDTSTVGDAFLPPVGPLTNPRVDALYAPGAQSAFAWLPDGTFWNGDFEIALLDPAGRPFPLAEPVQQYAEGTPGLGPNDAFPAGRREQSFPWGRLEVHAFVPWDGTDADTARWTLVQVVPRPHDETAPFSLKVGVRSGGEAGRYVDPRAPVGEHFRYETDGARLLRDGRTLALLVPSQRHGEASRDEEATSIPPRDAAATERVPAFARDLIADDRASWNLWLAPVGGAAADARPPGMHRPAAVLRAQTRRAWESEMARGASIVPVDPRTNAAFLAASRLLVGNRERRDGALHFLGNPFQYRDLYLRDGARVVRALLVLGRPDLATPALQGLFAFQWPGGAFVSQRGQLDGTGQALWALGQYAALGGDARVVDTLLDPALRAARWIALQRASSERRGGPAAGLLPYADPRDNELLRGHLLGNDAWALAGLEALAPLLLERGRAASADSVAREAAAYRLRLVEVWDREAARQGRPLPPSIGAGAREWGNWSAVYPCAVFAPSDRRAVALDAHARARHFRDGLAWYGSRDSLHHYLGFDLTHAALLRGDAPQVGRDLAALLDHAQPDGSGFEIAHASDGTFGDNLPPHGTFAAMLVDLVRCAMVDERGDSLVLFAGIVPGSLRAEHAFLRRAPTRFGAVDFVLAAGSPADTSHTLEVSLPAPAVVHWPAAGRIRSVRGTHGAAPRVGDRSFVLPAGRGTWTVIAAGGAR